MLAYHNKLYNWVPSESVGCRPQTSFICGDCWTLYTTKKPVIAKTCLEPCDDCRRKRNEPNTKA